MKGVHHNLATIGISPRDIPIAAPQRLTNQSPMPFWIGDAGTTAVYVQCEARRSLSRLDALASGDRRLTARPFVDRRPHLLAVAHDV